MLKKIFFALFIRPIVLLVAGVHVKNRENLPQKGPCIIVANHNSHLDTMVLMSLFPLSHINQVRPVAAADYFLKSRLFSWFSKEIIGIIPLKRKPKKSEGHPLLKVQDALKNGDIIILFPEGSRGEPEEMTHFKSGISHLVKDFPNVPIVPIYIYGAGKSLPKGEALFVPFIIDVTISKPIYYDNESNQEFATRLESEIKKLQKYNQ
jgi:1-acyl-sn-glycerol-3-phosphate acyltransferase